MIGATKKAIDKARTAKIQAAMTRIGLGSRARHRTIWAGAGVQADIGFPAVLRPSFTLGGRAAESPTTRTNSSTVQAGARPLADA
jgi:carbamoyl-phosphate synthase large subunit